MSTNNTTTNKLTASQVLSMTDEELLALDPEVLSAFITDNSGNSQLVEKFKNFVNNSKTLTEAKKQIYRQLTSSTGLGLWIDEKGEQLFRIGGNIIETGKPIVKGITDLVLGELEAATAKTAALARAKAVEASRFQK